MRTFLASYRSIELCMTHFDHTIEIHRNIRDNTSKTCCASIIPSGNERNVTQKLYES